MAIRSKDAEDVANAMYWNIMGWGRPQIAHCDNGNEFLASLMILLRCLGIKIINGGAYKPHVQGLVEQGNRVFKTRLNAWLDDNKTDNWPLGCLVVSDRNRAYIGAGLSHQNLVRGTYTVLRLLAPSHKLN